QVKHASAHEYLLRRGLSENTVQAYDIGFAPSGWDNLIRKFSSNAKVIAQLVDTGMVVVNEKGKMYDRFRERIMFPIRDRRGRVIAFGGRVINDGVPKYLNSPETEIFHKSAELYGLNTVIKSGSGKDCLLVVEGYMDVVSLANQGVTNAVATLGTAITEQHVQILTKQTSTIVYCFDGDAAGTKAAWRALETSLPYLQKGLQIKFMFLPDGEDPDTMVSRLGAAGFEVLINKAKPLSDFMLEKLLSEANYQTTEGEANLIEKARPLINKLPKGGFVNLVVGRLAKYVQLPEPVLLQQLRGGDEAAGRRSYRRSAPNMRKLASERPSIIKSAIAMLLEKPALALDVKDPASLKRLLVPGVALLHDLLVFVQENPNISTGGILEHWRDTEESKFLLKILAWQHHVPEKGLDAEFLAAIASLFCQLKEQELENLLNKSKVSPLSEKEKQRLSLLMKEIAK
ncbi:MAG TPA: DNA primase, partial [Gammaproteobacteria bacterium]|nr:DNA primase [Gammaproteobacteria bacterium]